MALSRERSATSFFSLRFSSSNSFRRRISSGRSPSYFFFQLNYIASLIPAVRQTSATGWPSAACFKMNAFWPSVNFDAFMASAPPGLGCYSGKLQFRMVQLAGSRVPGILKRKTSTKSGPVCGGQSTGDQGST